MAYLGSWRINDLLTFPTNTHDFSISGNPATPADSVPSYRVYEDETGTAILTGSMAKLDVANTVGFYSEQITLSAANGFEFGKSYTIYIARAVTAYTTTEVHTFQIGAASNVVYISGDLTAADNAESFFDGTGYAGTNNVIPLVTTTTTATTATNVTTVNGLANNVITAASIATDAIGSAELAATAANKIADHVYRRSWATAAASADGDTKSFRSLLGAIAKLVNKAAISGSTLTIYEDDDSTALGSQAVTTNASADPISALDTA